MWTSFNDMHSGGYTKEPPYDIIFIEAPEDEARVIFYNRFGHSPDRVSCTCCGQDYSMSSEESFKELSGYHRGCEYAHNDAKPGSGRYFEEDEPLPDGFKKSFGSFKKYYSVDEYMKREDVLVIPKQDILDSERVGDVPQEGYVWMG